MFDYASTSASGTNAEFWYEASPTEFQLSLATGESKLYAPINLSGIGTDEIYFFGSQSAYMNTQSGLSWTKYQTTTNSEINESSAIYDGNLYIGGTNAEIYQGSGGSWEPITQVPAVSIYSLEAYNNNLMIGSLGQIFQYNVVSGLETNPDEEIDVPVYYISAEKEYGGLLFIATEDPNYIYTYDGTNLIQNTTFSFSGNPVSMSVYQGNLYLSTTAGYIYQLNGINGTWTQVLSGSGSATNFSQANGFLYVAIGESIYALKGTNSSFINIYTTSFSIDTILATAYNIWITSAGNIYFTTTEVGWTNAYSYPVNASIYAGNQFKFELSDPNVVSEIKHIGDLYVRWKQSPNDGNWYEFPSSAGGGGSTTAANLGTGIGIYKEQAGDELLFESLVAGSGINIVNQGDSICAI